MTEGAFLSLCPEAAKGNEKWGRSLCFACIKSSRYSRFD